MMPCPICDATLELTGSADDRPQFWHCPRCGTLVMKHTDGAIESFMPKLVERCRHFANRAAMSEAQKILWHTTGIRESIHPPHERV